MTRDEWKRAEPLLTEALLLPQMEARALLSSSVLDAIVRSELLDALESVGTSAHSPLTFPPGSDATASPCIQVDEPVTLTFGDTLDNKRFVIIRPIGHGGMGVVYLAQDTTLGTLVALKVVRAKQGVIEEAQRAAACSGHEHVATVHNVMRLEHNGQPLGVLVMDYIAGRSVSRILEDGPVPPDVALRWMRQAAAGVGHAHDCEVLHCDLKPANLIITLDDRVKVVDFGIARASFEVRDRSAPARGTLPYMAPEQLLSKEFSRAGDVYALGVTLFELLTGRLPFEGDAALMRLQILKVAPPRLADLVPGLPDDLQAVVDRALAKNPEDRFPTARAFARALEHLDPMRTGTVTAAIPVGDPARAKQTAAALKYLRYAGLLLLAAAASGLLTAWTFNFTVDRPRQFDPDSLGRQLALGFQSLLIPITIGSLTWGVVSALQFLGQTVCRLRPVARWLTPRQQSAADRRTDMPAVIGLVVGGLLAVVMIFWLFDDITSAFITRVSAATPSSLAALRPENRDRQVLYRVCLPILLVVLMMGWRATSRMGQRSSYEVPNGVTAAAFGLMGVLFILSQAPYKLLTEHSEMPVVLVDQRRCYLLGESGAETRLYCPAWDTPRVRTVQRASATITNCGFEENVFSGTSATACQAPR